MTTGGDTGSLERSQCLACERKNQQQFDLGKSHYNHRFLSKNNYWPQGHGAKVEEAVACSGLFFFYGWLDLAQLRNQSSANFESAYDSLNSPACSCLSITLPNDL